MKINTAILVAVALTVFVLVLAGGIVYAVNAKTVTTNLAAATDAPIAQPNQNTTTVQQPTQAAEIALRFIPGSVLLQQPQLVNYQGAMAYEVLLDMATIYVDALNGKIIAASAVVVQNQQPAMDTNAGGNFYAEAEHDGEHEEHEAYEHEGDDD